MNSQQVEYKIYGDDLQAVEIELEPQETIVAEAGGMNWMEEDIVFEARLGDGSKPNSGFFGKILGIGKRLLTGESIFLTHFTNQGVGKKCVAFASPYPGKILPLDLSKVGGSVICQKDAFLCAAKGTEITITLTKKLGTGFWR